MKKIHQNLIIGALILLAISFIVVWAIEVGQKQAKVTIPNIQTVYTVADFPDSERDAENAQTYIDRLNTDQKTLIESTYESESQHYDLWIDIANIKFTLMDLEGAVEAWEYAIVINDASPLAYANLANYYKSFARDYEQAIYYYDQTISRDNIGYFFDYQAYAELYINYLPEDSNKAEIIMLDGVEKAQGMQKLDFYSFLYNYFGEKENQNKIDFYKNEILEIDPNYEF